jgi:hypothetical protein
VSLGDVNASSSKWRPSLWAAGLLRLVPLVILPTLALAVLSLVAWASLTYEIPVSAFTRDMATLAQFPLYVSITSSLGAFLMCATATCCLFAAAVARETGRDAPWHVLAAGLFSLYLVADDFYEFHDRLIPSLGIPQQLVHLLIATTAAAITFRWWRNFLAFRPVLLALALGFLGFSMAFDVFDDPLWELLGDWQFFWEDGAKLIGISLWATYFMSLARHALSRP